MTEPFFLKLKENAVFLYHACFSATDIFSVTSTVGVTICMVTSYKFTRATASPTAECQQDAEVNPCNC